MKTKIILCLVVIYSLVFSLACDRMKAAVNASARISKQVENLVDQNEKSYNAGLYDKATALKVAELLKKAIPAARAFNQSVRQIKDQYAGGKPPRSEFDRLTELFFAVETPIRDVLVIYGALSDAQNAIVEATIAAIREAIAIIRDSFSLAGTILKEEKQWQIQKT